MAAPWTARLSLQARLALLLVAALLLALLAFGLLADWLFVQLQRQALEQLLLRDLARVQALVEESAVGAPFIDDERGGFTLQFVGGDGRVRLPATAPAALPLAETPRLQRTGDGAQLLGALPWRTPAGTEIGTIRLALDASGLLQARRTLVRSLLASGALIALLAALGGLLLLRGALAPLARLAAQADALDPADPRPTPHRGPDDEVALLARALNRALEAIRARQRAERDALAEVAHELAAPLSVVAGQLERAALDDPRVLAARDAARELLHTSRDLLLLARGELEAPLQLRVVDLAAVAQQVAREYPGVRFERPTPETPSSETPSSETPSSETPSPRALSTEVLADSDRLRQLVRNLVRNAVQAAGRPQGVALQLDADADEVRLAVVDDGPGLDAEAAARVFDRYYRRRSGAGAGVGLSVAQALALRHDGRIGVRSTPGEGSVFTLHLPTLEAALDDEDGPGAGSGRDERGEGDEGVGAPRTGPALSAPGSGRRR